MSNPVMSKYARLTLYGTKRVRAKAWKRLVELCGFDSEGLVNYARASKYLTTALGKRELSDKWN